MQAKENMIYRAFNNVETRQLGSEAIGTQH